MSCLDLVVVQSTDIHTENCRRFSEVQTSNGRDGSVFFGHLDI